MTFQARRCGLAKRMTLKTTAKGESLECHLEFQQHPPIVFEMDARGAMVLMLSLRHFQRKHHWPIPLVRFSTSQ
jgi:hypothetical protein